MGTLVYGDSCQRWDFYFSAVLSLGTGSGGTSPLRVNKDIGGSNLSCTTEKRPEAIGCVQESTVERHKENQTLPPNAQQHYSTVYFRQILQTKYNSPLNKP